MTNTEGDAEARWVIEALDDRLALYAGGVCVTVRRLDGRELYSFIVYGKLASTWGRRQVGDTVIEPALLGRVPPRRDTSERDCGRAD